MTEPPESPEITLDKNLKRTSVMADAMKQMMFVSGETAEPSPETTMLVEFIVQQQVMEMVCHMIYLASSATLLTTSSSKSALLLRRDAEAAALQLTT